MAWQPVAGSYVPAPGEKIRVRFRFFFFLPVSEGDLRNLIESAGLQVVSVTAGPAVVLLAPGNMSASEIGKVVENALSDSVKIFWVTIEGYDRETVSLLPEPSPSFTISLVALAILALVALWFARKVL